MISRREFLKIVGLSTVAYSAGLQIGKILSKSEATNVHLTAFLPEEEFYANYLIQKFLEKIENEIPERTIKKLKKINIKNSFESESFVVGSNDLIKTDKEVSILDDKVSLIIRKDNYPFNCDIFLKDDEKQIYSPEDLSEIFFIRDDIKNKRAKIKLACSFSKDRDNASNTQFNKKVLIESNNEIWDAIPISSSYKNIEVKSSNGSVNFSISDKLVKVHAATCRNKLCIHSGSITQIGESLICAPNKILIKIINA